MPNAELRPLRQLAATLAYRAAKVLRDAPPSFATYRCADSTRTPIRIVAHMGDLMAWGERMARGEYLWRADGGCDWATEVRRFFDGLAALDRQLASAPVPDGFAEKLIQGPFADALTHVGQLAMLRGAAGVPVRPESYARAEIVPGRCGPEQSPPRVEFDGDASART